MAVRRSRTFNLVVGVAAVVVVGASGYRIWGEVQTLRQLEQVPPQRTRLASDSFHGKPIVERDGRRYLWARDDDNEETGAQWFDVTDSTIDPREFQYGIGKDSIPAIDRPAFVRLDDPRLTAHEIKPETQIIGYVHNGQAKAYPLDLLNRHELVNDFVGGRPVTVGY